MSEEFYTCAKCGIRQRSATYAGSLWYHVSQAGNLHHFCSRGCVVEFFGPELKQAVVVKQWVPTQEEERKMSGED